jgi:hypothetical protein
MHFVDVLFRAATATASLLGIGASAYVVSRRLTWWRLRRAILTYVGKTTTAVHVANHDGPPSALDCGFAGWMNLSLIHGAFASTWHAMQFYSAAGVERSVLSSTSIAMAVVHGAGMTYLAFAVGSGFFAYDNVETLVQVGRVWMLVYSCIAPVGAICLVVDGVACAAVVLTVSLRSWTAERHRRAWIAEAAFGVHRLRGHRAAVVVYLHQTNVSTDIMQPCVLVLSVVGLDGLLGRRLTACVCYSKGDDRAETIVNVNLDGHVPHPVSPPPALPPPHAEVVLGLRLLRSALSPGSALSHAAGTALAGEVAAHHRRTRAQRLIRRAWTEAVTDPEHPACVRRLRREFDAMTAVDCDLFFPFAA